MERKFEALEMTPEAHFLVGDCPECGAPKYTWEKRLGEWHCPKCNSVFSIDSEAGNLDAEPPKPWHDSTYDLDMKDPDEVETSPNPEDDNDLPQVALSRPKQTPAEANEPQIETEPEDTGDVSGFKPSWRLGDDDDGEFHAAMEDHDAYGEAEDERDQAQRQAELDEADAEWGDDDDDEWEEGSGELEESWRHNDSFADAKDELKNRPARAFFGEGPMPDELVRSIKKAQGKEYDDSYADAQSELEESFFDKRIDALNDDPTGEHQDNQDELAGWRANQGPAPEGEHEDSYKSPVHEAEDTDRKILAVADSLKTVVSIFFPDLKDVYMDALAKGDKEALRTLISTIDQEVLGAPMDFAEDAVQLVQRIHESFMSNLDVERQEAEEHGEDWVDPTVEEDDPEGENGRPFSIKQILDL